MENLELQNVVKELCEGRELTKQLQTHLLLHDAADASSHQNVEFLLHKILYSYDQALSILAPTPPAPAPAPLPDSPRSPHTEDSDQDQLNSRKRKVGVVRWSEKIKVGGEAGGIEGQLDDGYGWRKYGQKDILGAKYPRGYYRCTYRHAQGCLATKQVQRSDNDPTTFEITYRRNHTCYPRPNNPMPDPQPEDPNPSTQNEAPFNIQTSLRVVTQDLGTNDNPPFNFTSNNHTYGTNIVENNYKPNDNINVNEYEGLELIPNSYSELVTTNSPTNFPFASSGFASNFNFPDPGFFP